MAAYSLQYCYDAYDFFNRDFFKEELGQKLKKCKIFSNKLEAATVFDPVWFEGGTAGLSVTVDGKNYIWISNYVFENKKMLLNVLLHEMIHLFDNMVNPDVRSYRNGHGAYWTQVANYATSLYGDQLGKIERYVGEEEYEKLMHYKMMRQTKTLSNVYLVKLASWDLVPVKNLTDKQIEELKKTDIVGIFKVKPDIAQTSKTRVTKYATFESLMDDIRYGLTADEENWFAHIGIKLGEDTRAVWINKNR